MNTCVLQPPNSQLLSDDIIGGVVPRAKQTERYSVADTDDRSLQLSESRQQNYMYTTDHADAQKFTPGSPAPGRGSPTDRKRKRQPSTSQLISKDESPPFTVFGDSKEAAVIMEQILSEDQRLRELRRLRQIRYRKKKEDYANSLEEKTRQMREEIEKLQQRPRAVSSAISTEENVWSVATEYIRLFPYGLKMAASMSTPTSSSSQPSAQQDFFRNAMAPDVVFNASRGTEAMIRSWKCISLSFQDVELELEGLRKRSADSLVAVTTTSVTITERTLRNVFPHLLGDEKGNKLARKLLNQRISMRGLVCFEWDGAYCRVASLMADSDMLTPIVRLVGSLEEAATVFEKSLISPDFKWKSRS